ncbi:MAG: aspartate--tRNA ligase [bacterium]
MERIFVSETVGKVGEEVLLKGWVNRRRDMGKLIFIDLRDRSGLIQVVFAPDNKELLASANVLRSEFCVAIKGKINARPAKQVNPDMVTGTVEMLALELEVLNESKTPAFEVDKDTKLVGEELRLKYRYLDLRSERMLKNLKLRDKVETFFRDYLHKKDFIEIETPYLTKGTPEGSREFLVPSRIHPGSMYVLPQSPQQFKQLLMVAGVERYFQVARCFRDEDQRGDRQPEFTQLDMELSFASQEDILKLVEEMVLELVKTVAPEKKIQSAPFPRITYKDAMEKYGNDKPDFRADKADKNLLAFEWVVDFPMFEKADDGSIQAVHHPFTSPLPEDAHLLETEPLRARANAYDLVLNGNEVFGGSMRIHKRELQNKVFQILGLDETTIRERFGHMLEAFEFGAPPHGGIASGIDRMIMILANEENIREVIPFPKTGDAKDLMMNAPAPMPDKALDEVHIRLSQAAVRAQEKK